MAPKNQVALITGASDGIGLELAKQFAAEGYHLILVSDNRAKLEDAAREIVMLWETPIEIIEANLAQPDGAREVYTAVHHLDLNVDVLVNNAGVGVYGKFASNDLAQELAMIELNVSSIVQLTKLFANDMLRHGGGRILFTSSIAALAGSPYLAVYAATKAFIFNFALGLREELRDSGITVTTLLPSETETNFFKRAQMCSSKIAQGKLADPAQVAKAGFEALMRGESHVAAPFKAKLLEATSHLFPETTKTHFLKKQQGPVEVRPSKRHKVYTHASTLS